MARPDDHQTTLLPPMKWNAWGDPAAAKPLSPGIRALLKQALGVDDSSVHEIDLDQVTVRPSALSGVDREALSAIVGPGFCSVDDRGRLLRAGGKSTLDLLRRRNIGVQDAPDAVLLLATRARSRRFCGIAVNMASRPSRSEAAPASSAAWTRSGADSTPSCRWICAD